MNNFPELRNRASNSISNILAAGGVMSIAATGTAFYLVACPTALEIKTSISSAKKYGQGTGEEMAEGQFYTFLELRNPSASPVSFELWYGFGRYIDTRAEVLDAYSTAKAYPLAGGQLAAGASVVFDGSSTGAEKQRKALLITNLDPGAQLKVYDAAGVRLMSIFPQTNIMLPISGHVVVKNENGAAVACDLGEIWYASK
jgi:hypothetical protein